MYIITGKNNLPRFYHGDGVNGKKLVLKYKARAYNIIYALFACEFGAIRGTVLKIAELQQKGPSPKIAELRQKGTDLK